MLISTTPGFAGAFWNGLMLPWWYQFIHRVLPVDNARTIAMKIMGNCVVWGCAGNACVRARVLASLVLVCVHALCTCMHASPTTY